jgi:UPF0755 protein
MKRAGIVATVIFAVLALVCGFGGTTVALLVTQPASSGSAIVVNFQVGGCGSNTSDSAASIAQRLQADGLIRNALAFRLLAKLQKLDTSIKRGNYKLSPGMTMNQIIQKLQTGHPDLILAGVNEGKRVTEYAAGFSNLPHFNADNFNKIVQTGIMPDGTKLSDTYWFVEPQQKNTFYALEGYLYPDHYEFDGCATEVDVVTTMLEAFAEQLCPGPSDNPAAYIDTLGDCKQHAATVDSKGTTVFAALEKYYDVRDDRHAIYQALTVASITMREIPSLTATHDIQGIASVYYNRWQHALGNANYQSDTGTLIQADPTVQYAHTTDTPPAAGATWWPNLNNQDLKSIDTKNPYNTYVFPGLPPGPIAAPITSIFLAAANPVSPDTGKLYYYFINGTCAPHKTYFATNQTDFNALVAQYITNAKC